MIGTLTGLQWWIYDSFKTAVGLATTGGGSSKAVVAPVAGTPAVTSVVTPQKHWFMKSYLIILN